MTIGNYSIIYADPPWQYQRSKVQGAAENHYPTMGIDELCALPVADLAAPDSVCRTLSFRPGQRTFFVGDFPPAPGGPAAHRGVGLPL